MEVGRALRYRMWPPQMVLNPLGHNTCSQQFCTWFGCTCNAQKGLPGAHIVRPQLPKTHTAASSSGAQQGGSGCLPSVGGAGREVHGASQEPSSLPPDDNARLRKWKSQPRWPRSRDILQCSQCSSQDSQGLLSCCSQCPRGSSGPSTECSCRVPPHPTKVTLITTTSPSHKVDFLLLLGFRGMEEKVHPGSDLSVPTE